MKSNQMWRLAGVAGIGSVLAGSALAQDVGIYPGFYGGLSIGQSRAEIDEERISAGLLGAGLATTAFARDEKDTAYKLFGGYQFNRYLGVEAGYFSLGKFGFAATTAPAGTLDGRIKLDGFNLDLVGTMPLTQRLSAIGRVGAQRARARDTFSGTGAVNVLDPNPSANGTHLKYGIGLQYAFSPSFLLRGEAERYRVNDAVGNRGDVNMVSLSVVIPFGHAPAPAPRPVAAAPYVAPTPAYVAPPPAPPPAVVAAAPAPTPAVVVPERRRVSFEADSLFGFDQTTVRPEGRVKLDAFVREVQGTRFELITVEGHTDRLGTAAYNQALSVRRAEVVKAFLASAGNFDAAVVSAVGKGETMPVTSPQDCRGSRATPELIACLQPDRRVEVEVSGTR